MTGDRQPISIRKHWGEQTRRDDADNTQPCNPTDLPNRSDASEDEPEDCTASGEDSSACTVG